MIRMMCECPTTGDPLLNMAVDDWTAAHDEVRITRHCPKCSELHTFSKADQVMELTPLGA